MKFPDGFTVVIAVLNARKTLKQINIKIRKREEEEKNENKNKDHDE